MARWQSGSRERLAAFKANRDNTLVAARRSALREAAASDANLLPAIRETLRAGATLGEVCTTMGEIFGSHRPGRAVL